MLEFGLVAPLLLMILFAIFEFGFAMHRLQGINAAAHDAARVGSLPEVTATQVEARVHASLANSLGSTEPTITIEPAGDTPCADDATEIVVTVEVDVALVIPFWESVTVPLDSRAEFACP